MQCSCTHFRSGRAVSIAYSLCVFVALGIQHAKLTPRITLSFVACAAVPNFSTLSYKRKDFRQDVVEVKMCVVPFSTFCLTFLSF